MGQDKSSKEILVLLEKKGIPSFSAVDRQFDLPPTSASNAARFPVPKGEKAIAHVLGCHPKDLWPSRFDATTGHRHRPQPAENYVSSKKHMVA